VVYIQIPNTEEPTFEGRDIVLGPRAGDYYVVASGLSEGERVVTHGNFKIDSALQIQAKPSMMNPAGDIAPPMHDHDAMTMSEEDPMETSGLSPDVPAEFQRQLTALWTHYQAIQMALAGDTSAEKDAAASLQTLQATNDQALNTETRALWSPMEKGLSAALTAMAQSQDLEEQRKHFEPLSRDFTKALKTFGLLTDTPIYEIKCPMAFDFKGANWLQDSQKVQNPYFGASMLTCGSVVDTIPGNKASISGGEAL
jgi:Cu(I)/Ag(I) efflux system membrane fusion protein